MYNIIIKKKAKKFIDKLPQNDKKRIVKAIESLPDGEDIKKLKGCDKCHKPISVIYWYRLF